jgi:hypothetical protein
MFIFKRDNEKGEPRVAGYTSFPLPESYQEVEVKVVYNDAQLSELIDAFENFVKGCGYSLNNCHLELVEDEMQELSDDDLNDDVNDYGWGYDENWCGSVYESANSGIETNKEDEKTHTCDCHSHEHQVCDECQCMSDSDLKREDR